MTNTSFFSRIQIAFKMMFSRAYAERVLHVEAQAKPQLVSSNTDGAQQLLALLQKEARLIDFTNEDIINYDDAQIGAAARVVHQGLQKAFKDHIQFEPLAPDSSAEMFNVPADFDPQHYRLTGNVPAQGPYKGYLVHPGWKVSAIQLPQTIENYDYSIIAPAEVEL